MNKLELLVLAAKAIKLKHVDYTNNDYNGAGGLSMLNRNEDYIGTWDPLNYDRDAFRLAAMLHIAVTYPFDENCVRCWYGDESTEPVYQPIGGDVVVATQLLAHNTQSSNPKPHRKTDMKTINTTQATSPSLTGWLRKRKAWTV